MTEERKFFIRVLRDYLQEEKTEAAASLNWKKIKEDADRHQLSAIFYKQTQNPIFQKSYAYQLYRYSNMKQMEEMLADTLKEIQYLTVKGSVVAELYPLPALRSMGDIDLLIHPDDVKKVHEALLSSGFHFIGEYVAAEHKYEKNGYALEVHDSLVHRVPGKEYLVEFFLKAWDHVEEGSIEWSFQLLYLIEHLHQHFSGIGVGFRQFMDIAIVCKKCEIDWNFVSEGLKEIRLYDFARTIFAFNEAWFDIPSPIEKRELSAEFFEKATERIFENGIFGFDNEENQKMRVARMMHYRGISYKQAKRRFLLENAVPPMRHMLRLPFCSYLHKYPFLLPFAWVHRFFYRIFDKEAIEGLKQQLSNERVESRMDVLKEWGL